MNCGVSNTMGGFGDALRVARGGPQYYLEHPDYKEISLESKFNAKDTFVATNETDGTDLFAFSSTGDRYIQRNEYGIDGSTRMYNQQHGGSGAMELPTLAADPTTNALADGKGVAYVSDGSAGVTGDAGDVVVAVTVPGRSKPQRCWISVQLLDAHDYYHQGRCWNMANQHQRPVVLLTVDCLRRDHVGCYGYDRPTTPNLDALAEHGDTTLFEFGYSNAPGTAWAFQSMFAGVWATQVGGVEGMGLPESGGRTLAEQFRKAGYRTGGFANNGWVSQDTHVDRGFDTFMGVKKYSRREHPLMRLGGRVDDLLDNQRIRETLLKPIHTVLQSRSGAPADKGEYRQRVTDADVCTDAIEWIRECEASDDPYFAWIHFMDAHTPYSRWDRHLEALRGDADVKHAVDPIDDVQVGEAPPASVIDAYDAGIRSADEQIGRLLSEIPDDATVAVTGDHGEEFGQYGGFHNISLHSSMTQVPLLIRDPAFGGDGEGVECGSGIAQHIDIPPTLVGLNSVESHETWVGQALHESPRAEGDEVLFCLSTHQGIRADGWKYIESPEYADGLLYHTTHGHHDDEDRSSEYPDRRNGLKTRVGKYTEWMNNNRIDSGGATNDDLSDAVEENLEELGYLER